MGIGSTYNYPADRAGVIALSGEMKAINPWSGSFPNPPDLNFNYRHLVEGTPIASAGKAADTSIAIIGAGITGLTTARELFRCGYKNITIFEASDRIGGRHYTITNVGGLEDRHVYSPFEMAAMRMPFFNHSGQSPLDGGSLLAMYAKEFDLSFEDFPNPGTKYVDATGIYLEDGLLSSNEPELIIWKNPDGITPPPNEKLKAVYEKWRRFHDSVVNVIAPIYGTSEWDGIWATIVDHYKDMTFRQFVLSDAVEKITTKNWGGLGLTTDESNIFYSIGFGDGSWGAFYDVCAIYPLRTAIFGFSSNLQLIHGRFDKNKKYNPGPHANGKSVPDSQGNLFESPAFIGVKSFDDCMLFLPISSKVESLYEFLLKSKTGIITSAKVKSLEKMNNQKTKVSYLHADEVKALDFDIVVLTIPSWLIEMNISMAGYGREILPFNIIRSWKTAHWETSCKVYAPLDPSFFLDKTNKIPQILVTDTYSHDLYAYKYGVGDYKYPAILVSYTWEDDATKLLSFGKEDLVNRCLNELDRALMRCTNIGQTISKYVLKDKAEVMHWITHPTSLGCAKLYREGTYADAMSLLAYNRQYSSKSGLYLAGESFSVDAGWTEPSFRGAIDTVINICSNTRAIFNKGFSMSVYPFYKVPT